MITAERLTYEPGTRVLVTVPATVVWQGKDDTLHVRAPGQPHDWIVHAGQVVPDPKPMPLPSGITPKES